MLKKKTQPPKKAKFQKINLPPKRKSNLKARSREYLATHEIDAIRKAARNTGRHGHRDDTIILFMFRHAFRVSEVISLRWDQIDLKQGLLHVSRIKKWFTLHASHKRHRITRTQAITTSLPRFALCFC